MPTTSDLLADWRAKAEAATEGPWEAGDVWVFSDPVYPDDHRLSDVLGTRFADAERAKAEHERGLRNAAFIADARTAVPALLSAVEAVHELCDKADAEAPASDRMFSGDSFPAYVSTADIRAAVSAALGTEEESND